NAGGNEVQRGLVDDLQDCLEEAEVITAADILYDPDNMPLLDVFRQASTVLFVDSRVANLNIDVYELITTIRAISCPDLSVITYTTWPDLSQLTHQNRVRLFLMQH